MHWQTPLSSLLSTSSASSSKKSAANSSISNNNNNDTTMPPPKTPWPPRPHSHSAPNWSTALRPTCKSWVGRSTTSGW